MIWSISRWTPKSPRLKSASDRVSTGISLPWPHLPLFKLAGPWLGWETAFASRYHGMGRRKFVTWANEMYLKFFVMLYLSSPGYNEPDSWWNVESNCWTFFCVRGLLPRVESSVVGIFFVLKVIPSSDNRFVSIFSLWYTSIASGQKTLRGVCMYFSSCSLRLQIDSETENHYFHFYKYIY